MSHKCCKYATCSIFWCSSIREVCQYICPNQPKSFDISVTYGLHWLQFSNVYPRVIMPTLAEAVLAYSDGSQFHFTAELQSTWLVTWAMKRRTQHPHPPTAIGHQELRLEVTWAMRRTPHPHWSSGAESWSDMSNKDEDPTPPWSSGIEG